MFLLLQDVPLQFRKVGVACSRRFMSRTPPAKSPDGKMSEIGENLRLPVVWLSGSLFSVIVFSHYEQCDLFLHHCQRKISLFNSIRGEIFWRSSFLF